MIKPDEVVILTQADYEEMRNAIYRKAVECLVDALREHFIDGEEVTKDMGEHLIKIFKERAEEYGQ